jgi:two-component system chemotaxis response regulator CheY
MARILIVDDALFVRYSLKQALTQAGHDVVGEAENGLDGLRQTNRLQPELVILDLNMPVMDGLTALQAIRRNHPEVRVLICTAQGAGHVRAEARDHGAHGFIAKPYHPEDLHAAVAAALTAVGAPAAA